MVDEEDPIEILKNQLIYLQDELFSDIRMVRKIKIFYFIYL